MFETFGRSWEVTKSAFSVLNQDKELMLYPIFTMALSLIAAVILFLPMLLLKAISAPFFIVMLFVFYFVFSFISTFFQVCATYTAKTRFEGGNATVSSSIAFTFSIIHLVIYWSLLSATVGVVLALLQNAARNQKNEIVRFVLNLVVQALGFAWDVITVFVVPAMVFKKLGPFASIKDSVGALKKTWGEKLTLSIGVFAIESTLSTIGLVVFGLTILVIIFTAPMLWLFVLVTLFYIIYLVILKSLFSVLNSIFNTALYIYATTGKIPNGFSKEQMNNAIAKEKDEE